jgi:hypothetical protein
MEALLRHCHLSVSKEIGILDDDTHTIQTRFDTFGGLSLIAKLVLDVVP